MKSETRVLILAKLLSHNDLSVKLEANGDNAPTVYVLTLSGKINRYYNDGRLEVVKDRAWIDDDGNIIAYEDNHQDYVTEAGCNNLHNELLDRRLYGDNVTIASVVDKRLSHLRDTLRRRRLSSLAHNYDRVSACKILDGKQLRIDDSKLVYSIGSSDNDLPLHNRYNVYIRSRRDTVVIGHNSEVLSAFGVHNTDRERVVTPNLDSIIDKQLKSYLITYIDNYRLTDYELYNELVETTKQRKAEDKRYE